MKQLSAKLAPAILGLLPLVVLSIAWEIVTDLNWVPRWILASPAEVWRVIERLVSQGLLWRLLGISLSNIAVAFSLAAVLSLSLAVLIGLNRPARLIFLPTLSFLYPIPTLAWLPIIIIIFGFSQLTIWIVVALSAFFKMVFIFANGVRGVDRQLIWAAQNMGYRGGVLIFKIILPAALPAILAGLRSGFGSAWRSLIGAELFVPLAGGLGAYIADSLSVFRFDQILAGVLIIALISYLFERLLFEPIENRVLIKYGMIRH